MSGKIKANVKYGEEENPGPATRQIFTRNLSEVIEKEQEYIQQRRVKARTELGESETKTDERIRPIGLAFSGGGIRSASFNFGIVQGLSRFGFLPFVDYLTSVSGGGFTASCLTSLLSYQEEGDDGRFPFNTTWERFPFNPSKKIWDGQKPSRQNGQNEQLRHLREKGNYLVPRGGFISRDWFRVLGSVFGGMGYIVVIYLLALIAVSALHLGLIILLLGGIPGEVALSASTLFSFSATWTPPMRHYVLTFLVGLIISILISFVLRANYRPDKVTREVDPPSGLDNQYVRDERYISRVFWVSLALFVIWIVGLKLNPITHGQIYFIWLPAVFTFGVGIGLIIFRIGTGRSRYEKSSQGEPSIWSVVEFRSIFWAYQGLGFYSFIGALVFAILAIPQLFINFDPATNETSPLSTTIISGLGAALVTYLSSQKSDSGGSLQSIISKIPSGVMNALLSVFVIVFNLSLVFIFQTVIQSFSTNYSFVPWIIVVAAIVLLVLVLRLINLNQISPHYFFRDRVGDVFLKTEVENTDGKIVTARDQSNVKLTEINPDGCSAPYHIVVGAINLPGSYDLKYKDRKSQHFNFSRDYTGSDVTGYALHNNNPDPKKRGYRKGATKYSRTIAISGAAASSAIGYVTSFAQAFILTLFNVRLGMWMINPKMYDKVSWDDCVKPFKEAEEKRFWSNYLVDEISAKISERRPMVNLSDGGHTGDNGALYPLFQRRCKLIFAGDASQDPKAYCKDLFRVIHYAKVDMGIDVNINVKGLKPRESDDGDWKAGWSKNHFAIGEITYPQELNNDGTEKYPKERGWLVYFKPSITADDRGEIIHYWETHKNGFPHPSTADQFFDEFQFEIQRFLGEITVEQTFTEFTKLDRYYKDQLDDINDQLDELIEADNLQDVDPNLDAPQYFQMIAAGLEDIAEQLRKKLKVVQDIQKGRIDYKEISEIFDNLMSDFRIVMLEE